MHMVRASELVSGAWRGDCSPNTEEWISDGVMLIRLDMLTPRQIQTLRTPQGTFMHAPEKVDGYAAKFVEGGVTAWLDMEDEHFWSTNKPKCEPYMARLCSGDPSTGEPDDYHLFDKTRLAVLGLLLPEATMEVVGNTLALRDAGGRVVAALMGMKP